MASILSKPGLCKETGFYQLIQHKSLIQLDQLIRPAPGNNDIGFGRVFGYILTDGIFSGFFLQTR